MITPVQSSAPPPRPLHVVQVVRQFAPAVGGLEEAVLKLSLALQALGVRVSVVTLDRVRDRSATHLARTEIVQGVPVTRIGFSGSWRYPLAPNVLQHLGEADVVHEHAVDFFFDYLALTRRMHGLPLVASTHGGFFHTPFARGLKKIYFNTVTRASARAYRAILASSRSDFETFQGIASGNLALVENGVDVNKWSGLAPVVPERTLIAIGRFAQHKQLGELIRVLAALRSLDARWRLVIAGRPWDADADSLHRVAAEVGISDALEVAVGPSDGEMAGLIGRASYLASASSYEGFGLGVVEGMAAGLVPVLNRIPAFSALVDSTGCGQLVDVLDPQDAARQIETLHHSNLARAGDLRTLCIAAAARFGWDEAAQRFLRHYQSAALRVAPIEPPLRRNHRGLEDERDRPDTRAVVECTGHGRSDP